MAEDTFSAHIRIGIQSCQSSPKNMQLFIPSGCRVYQSLSLITDGSSKNSCVRCDLWLNISFLALCFYFQTFFSFIYHRHCHIFYLQPSFWNFSELLFKKIEVSMNLLGGTKENAVPSKIHEASAFFVVLYHIYFPWSLKTISNFDAC